MDAGGVEYVVAGGRRSRRRPSLSLIPPAVATPPIYGVMGDHGSPPGPPSASHIVMWMSGVLCRRVVVDILFVAHLVPWERFKWYKSGL